jgi:hypothetical protein
MTVSKIFSVAAAATIAVAALATTPSFAQGTKVVGVGPGGARTLGTFSGGGGPRFGGGGGPRFGGGGGGWAGGPRFGGGGGGWHRGGGWRGGGYGPGFAAGAIIGSGLAASSYYNSYGAYGGYGGSPYYGGSYYEDDAPDVVEVAPHRRRRRGLLHPHLQIVQCPHGTYLGYDGQRHACP